MQLYFLFPFKHILRQNIWKSALETNWKRSQWERVLLSDQVEFLPVITVELAGNLSNEFRRLFFSIYGF
jgi:hypothetical protein